MSVLVLRCLLNDWVFLKIAEGRRVVRIRNRSRGGRIRAERTRVRAIERVTTSRADTKTTARELQPVVISYDGAKLTIFQRENACFPIYFDRLTAVVLGYAP